MPDNTGFNNGGTNQGGGYNGGSFDWASLINSAIGAAVTIFAPKPKEAPSETIVLPQSNNNSFMMPVMLGVVGLIAYLIIKK